VAEKFHESFKSLTDGQIVLREIDSGETYPLSLPCVIGRGKDADLAFPDVTISHRHARIDLRHDGIWIEDLGSANGVFVNDRKIEREALLRAGDSVQLGQMSFLVSHKDEDVSSETRIVHAFGPETGWSLDHQRLLTIYEIAAELAGRQDMKVLGEKIFSRFREMFRCDRGYIAIFDERGALIPVLVDPQDKTFPLSRSVINRLFQSGESFLLEDALDDRVLKEKESVIALRIRSAMCVPLICHDQMYGLIYLDKNEPAAYGTDDLAFLKSIAFILAPLLENARLWTELKGHYDDAVELLKKTETRLIEMERKAAYVRLAQAMAHEIRNPLMVMGALVRRLERTEPEDERFGDILTSVSRMESVLKEVDDFIKIPLPEKKLGRIDGLIEEELRRSGPDWQGKSVSPHLSVITPHVTIPLDADLMRKAVDMIFREVLFNAAEGASVEIVLRDSGGDLEIAVGTVSDQKPLCDLHDVAMQGKPFSYSLFLNIAHKIISDHGGTLLLDPDPEDALTLVMRLPRMINV